VISGATTGTNESPPSLELMECDKNLDDNWARLIACQLDEALEELRVVLERHGE
jgi:hypothetical protein